MTVRQQKVSAQIRRIVSTILLREIGDPRVTGMITVTKVEITPDLRSAQVYVSILQPAGPIKTVMAGLKAAAPKIQVEVAEALPIRVAPHVEFVLDESIKKEAEILNMIDQVARERQTPAAPPPEPQ